MKQLNDIKKKIEWEEYYNPTFDWNDWKFYLHNKLSENFIREFQNKVNWDEVSRCQKLSEDFIREFKNKVNWVCISIYQKLSKDFKKEFKKELNCKLTIYDQTLKS